MTPRQKRLAFVLVFAAIIISAIPTVLLFKYEWQVLPVFDLKFRLPQSLSKSLPPIPFSITVGTNNIIRMQADNELSEKQKLTIGRGLQLLFHAYANNLAYYFPYFTTIEFGSEENLSAFVLVFSQEIPRVSVEEGSKRVHWKGQRINFDVIQRRLTYVVDGFFEFKELATLKVGVFYSSSLELKQVEPEPEPNKPKGERL